MSELSAQAIAKAISQGKAALGIELGSTRIKAVLIGEDMQPIAQGNHSWENQFENGVWTYSLEAVHQGLQAAYQELKEDVRARYGQPLSRLKAIGVSAMMHGYLAFDQGGQLLTPFRTWRNTMTEQAAAQLSSLFQFNIPQRWCIAHLQQAILNQEAHVAQIAHLTTLAGYVHWQLSGQKLVGIGDAAGIFPIDSSKGSYHEGMLQQFQALHPQLPWQLKDILPGILPAGEQAGSLSAAGARLLDPSGELQPGIPCCPPEGDAGTGMVATNSVAPGTGNISAGTSIFAMIVLEKALKRYYPEVDMVCTPSGSPVAMVHCNNCTTELNAWVGLFQELCGLMDVPAAEDKLFSKLYNLALEGEPDGGGLTSYNFSSGEHIVGIEQGRPLFVKTPDSRFTLANFMRTQLFSAMSCLRLGMDILLKGEQVHVDRLLGHGGLFKTPVVAQRLMAAAMQAPVTVMDTAGEGGAWGIALLAAFVADRAAGEKLEDFLEKKVFAQAAQSSIAPDPKDVAGFNQYLERYQAGLAVAKAAEQAL